MSRRGYSDYDRGDRDRGDRYDRDRSDRGHRSSRSDRDRGDRHRSRSSRSDRYDRDDRRSRRDDRRDRSDRRDRGDRHERDRGDRGDRGGRRERRDFRRTGNADRSSNWREDRDDKDRGDRSDRPQSPNPFAKYYDMDPEEFFLLLKKEGNSNWDKLPGQVMKPAVAKPSVLNNPLILRQQRRLYVGNVPRNITEAQLVAFFNTAIQNSGTLKPGDDGSPVTEAVINQEKAYAFVEFRTPEEATIGMDFDGITLEGQALRMRRPKDFQPLSEDQVQARNRVNLGIVSTNVEDSTHKIFIGGLPQDLNESDIKELLSLFGSLKSFNLVRDNNNDGSRNSLGFAFCEFSDPSVTDTACARLNGMSLGDKTLVVQRASVNAKNKEQPEMPKNVQAAHMLNMAIPAAQLLAQAVANSGKPCDPTRVLVLMNIIDAEKFRDNDERLARAEEDIRLECEKFGTVLRVVIPKPKKRKTVGDIYIPIREYDAAGRPVERQLKVRTEYGGDYDDAEDPVRPSVAGVGKVFIEFKEIEEAKAAQKALAGRRWDNRMCITSYFDEDKFKVGDLRKDDSEK
mmetsp:Transcript_24447/g.27189  ORF Transcript_24447/g.27189 Transcript_24447/m.27189 type:complete len:569 (+) Transcript_24447:56-1762(+)